MVTGSRGKNENAADWLENELRETKGRLHKVEAELAQALKQTYGLEAEMRKLMESLAVAGSMEAMVASVREEVRGMREQVSRLSDRQAAVTTRVDQVLQQRQQDQGRSQNEFASAVKQIEAINRQLESYDARSKVVDETLRHVEDDVAGMRLNNQALDRMLEEMTSRAARTHEATMRIDQETARMAGELLRLEKTDEALTDRLAAYLEQLRRTIERMDKLEPLATFADETRDNLQRAATEREQLAAKIAAVDHETTRLAETSQEFAQVLAKLDQRSQNQNAETILQGAALADLTDNTKQAIKKIYTILLRQGRRRTEALNQEIKELTQGEIHAND